MKAYILHDKGENYTGVVFADTSGKAKALGLELELFECCHFTDIIARRAPLLDKYYTAGKYSLDWYDPADRVILVQNADFFCSDEIKIEDCYCESCTAKNFCSRYELEFG